MSEVEKNVEGSVVNCDSLVDVNKRDFGNQYLEWKKVWFKSQFFQDKTFQRGQVWKFLLFFFSKISTLLILCKLFLPRAQHLVFRYPTCIFVGIITDESQFSLCALVSPYPYEQGLTNTHTARGFSVLYHVLAWKQCILCSALRYRAYNFLLHRFEIHSAVELWRAALLGSLLVASRLPEAARWQWMDK